MKHISRHAARNKVLAENSKIFYKGAEGIRRSGLEIPLTPEQKEEEKRCSEDIYYFIENYCHIITLDGGLELFKLRGYQREAIEFIINNRLAILKWGRQFGKCFYDKNIKLYLIPERKQNFVKWCLFKVLLKVGILKMFK